MRPNIVLILCDQMRGDCLGFAGHPDVKTPYLDMIASEGSYFPNAYSAVPSCIASRAALLTGQSQDRHGRVGYQDGVEWHYPQMFPDVFAKNDYTTAMFGKMHVHPPAKKCGFQQTALHDGYLGYYRRNDVPYYQHQLAHDDYVRDLKRRHGIDADITAHGVECNSWLARPWIYDDDIHPTHWVTDRAVDFIKQRDRTQPFLLKASFVRPHPPFDAPGCYFDMYRDVAFAPPARGDWDGSLRPEGIGKNVSSMFGTDDEKLRREAMAGYYACITHMDHQIGRIYGALAEEGQLENSVIIFTSDHGELLFDHGLYRKVLPYQGSVHIPLIVRVGRNVAKAAAPVCSELAELRDIAPTMLDFAGLAIPERMDGVSLAGALLDGGSTREFLHGEHSSGQYSNHYVVSQTDKFVWYSQTGREQYFDLGNDPGESCDLIESPAHQARIGLLRGQLIGELEWREEGYVEDGKLIAGQQPRSVLSSPK